MKRITILLAVALTSAALLPACSTAPKTQADRSALTSSASTSVSQYRSTDPGISEFFDTSYAYAMFPSVGSGAFIVGGGFGRGVVYEQHVAIGFADITSASVGLQAGGQGFSQVVFFQTKDVLDQFKAGNFSFSADANAVAVESGAAAQTTFRNGVAVFIQSQGGLMASAALGGQRFRYQAF